MRRLAVLLGLLLPLAASAQVPAGEQQPPPPSDEAQPASPEPSPSPAGDLASPQTPAPETPSTTGAPAPSEPAPTPAAPAATQAAASAQGSATPSEPPAQPSTQKPRPTMDQVAEDSVVELHFGPVKARYSFNFFGDVSFGGRSPSGEDGKPSFSLGAQDLLVRGELGNNIVATTECAFEFDEETNEAGIDLERLHVRWQNDHFFVEAGRSHTDIGFWNQAYHHGKWLQLPIERPRWVQFEDDGGILPIHWVGLSAGARAAVGPGKLHFTASVGNERGKIVDDIRNEYDYSAAKAVHAKLEYVGLGLRDLRLGVTGIYGRIPGQPASVRPALPDVAMDEWIGGVHVAYPSVPLLLIAEAYLVEHVAESRHFATYGGFVLLGYAIDVLTPYVELAGMLASRSGDPFLMPDPAAEPQVSREVFDLAAGARLDVSAWSALKLEYDYSNERAHEASHAVRLDWSWGF